MAGNLKHRRVDLLAFFGSRLSAYRDIRERERERESGVGLIQSWSLVVCEYYAYHRTHPQKKTNKKNTPTFFNTSFFGRKLGDGCEHIVPTPPFLGFLSVLLEVFFIYLFIYFCRKKKKNKHCHCGSSRWFDGGSGNATPATKASLALRESDRPVN